MSDQPFDQHDPTQSTKDVAKEESKNLGNVAMDNAGSVAQTAGTEAKQVAGEAKAQVSSLYHQVREDVTGQAREQQQRAAGGLHGLAGEFTQMADGTEDGGMAAGLARQAAQRVDAVAGWLEHREPADVLEEVRRYARRSPGTFLAACAAVGFIGGRLTRGLRDDAQDEQQEAARRQSMAPALTGTYPGDAYAEPLSTAPPTYGGRPAAGEPATTYVAGGTAPLAGDDGGPSAEADDLPGTAPLAGSEPVIGTDPYLEGTGTDPYTDGGDRR